MSNRIKNLSVQARAVMAGLGALFMAVSVHGMEQIYTLYSFQLGPANPQGGLVAGPDGGLYGTTYGGGLCGYGTAFRLATNGVPTTNGVVTNLFSFCYTNGANPETALARRIGSSDTNLYGTTYQGGSNGFGTVFRMTTTGGLSLLATFDRNNGAYPAGALVSDANGNLYGTTSAGGASCVAGGFSGFGTIFKLTAESGGSYSLHRLVSLWETNGAGPQGALTVGRDGNLYGTTTSGGLTNNGTAFKMTPDGELRRLVSFSSYNGASPCGGLVQGSNGVFYGTTAGGGISSNGTVFAMTTDGELTTVFFFNGANGSNPQAGLASADGANFFGTTYSGGLNGLGTIFRIAPDGSLTTLVSFDYANGANPQGPLCLAGDGIFYGTTENGGLYGAGTAFSLTTNGDFITVASFARGAGFPAGGLLAGTNANFYGTTAYGGPNNSGTVFELTSNGVLSMLIPFMGSTNVHPQGNLVQGIDGALYGTTFGGGAGGLGSVFRASSTGAVATVVSFTNNNGAYPLAGLLATTNGNLYGTTSQGGPSDTGTAFEVTVTPTNTFLMTHLASFLDYSPGDGAFPEGPMAQGTNGNFYGTTAEGGTDNCGTIFGLTTSNAVMTYTVVTTNTVVTITTVGTTPTVVTTTTVATTTTVLTNVFYFLTNVFSFAYHDGCSPQTGLMVASNGNFYGTTAAGGSNGCGTVFRMTTEHAVTNLAFGGDYGVTPQGPLVEGTDGNFYGTTYSGGGPGAYGTVFSVSPAFVLSTCATFYWTNGAYPNGGLVLGQDGRIYGTTSQGGTCGAGTVFWFETPDTPAPLSYSRNGAQIIVSRSSNAAGLTLQSSTNLADWVNVEGQYAVTNDCSQGRSFFRLVNTNQPPGRF